MSYGWVASVPWALDWFVAVPGVQRMQRVFLCPRVHAGTLSSRHLFATMFSRPNAPTPMRPNVTMV